MYTRIRHVFHVTIIIILTTLAWIAFSVPVSRAEAALSDTVASWAFNENSGTISVDSVASLQGTFSGGATWTANGKAGSAASFNGLNGVVTAQSSSLNALGQLTVSAWIKRQSLGENNHGWIVGKASGGGNLPSAGWALLLTNSDGKTVSFVVDHANLHLEVVAKADSITLGAWNHVAVTWNGSSQASGVQMYINGAMVTTAYASNGSGSSVSDSNYALTIGNNPVGSRSFNGDIDDVMIANRVFSASEVQTLMNSSGSTNPPPSTPPATVSLLSSPSTISAGGSSTLTWTSTDATSCTASGGWSGTKAVSGNQTVTPSSSTTYTLTCTGAGGSGSASATVTVSPVSPHQDTTAPTVPAGLNGTATANSISLTWTASTDDVGVTGYKVYRNGVQIGTAATPAYTDAGLASGTTYTYVVAAYDAAGNTSAQSSPKSIATASSTTPPAPTVALVAAPTSITSGQSSALSWASTNATSCTASGGWSGTKATSGNQTVTPSSSTTYTLTCTGAGGSGSASATTTVTAAPPPPSGTMPTGKILWDWQIGASDDSKITMPAGLRLLDVDLFNTSAAKVAEMKAKGIYAVCYINAGSWQPGYPDSDDYPDYLKIKRDPDWPQEYFLDVTDVFKPNSVLATILKNRLALCKQKGFDAVEPDNLQNDENAAGLITLQQQIDFNGWFADAAHAAGLKVLQKNGPDKIDKKTTYDGQSMLDKFDGILNEECQQYNECEPLAKYVAKGKLGLNVEYKKAPNCALSDQLNINTIQKDLNLVGGAMSGYKWNTTCLTSGTPQTTSSASSLMTAQNTAATPPSVSTPSSMVVGSTVVATDRLKVRSAPELGQNKVGTAAKGATGTVVDGPVTASGYTWWKVSYLSGLVGWSASDWLQVM